MKEAFEKIKERLEEKAKETSRRWIPQNEGDSKFFSGMVEGLLAAQKIVSEVEAEYGNGCDKKLYRITLEGCDDETIFDMDLTESEYHFISRVSEIANKTSYYGCMPRLYVELCNPTND